MAHSSMYQLLQELRQRVYELTREVQHHEYEAKRISHYRDHKQKQVDVLVEQIATVEAYEREQYEKSKEIEGEV